MKTSLALILLLVSFTVCAMEKVDSLQVSELFVNLTHPKVLYADHATLGLIPASVTKLFVAAAALEKWGAYHTFATKIYQRGQWENGVLTGDLVFYSQGDPEFTNEKMWQLVNNLQQKGLKKINGNIIVNASYFGKVMISAPDRLAAKFYSKVSYDGLPSSGGSNFATIAVSILPGQKVGDLASLSISPYPVQNAYIKGKVFTQTGKANTLQLNRLTQKGKEIITVSGTIGIQSNPVILYSSVGHPNVTTGVLLKSFLQQVGIIANGKIRVEWVPIKKTDKLLTQLSSLSLMQCIQDMLRYSNNYIADMLTLDLWRENQHAVISSVKLNNAANILLTTYNAFLAKSSFTKQGDHSPILDSGSGLTPANRLSASNLVTLLEKMYQNKCDFPIFYGSLIVPGQQTSWHNILTLEHPWMSRVSVKTGHITVPKIVDSMAGYFRMQNGDLGAFAVLFNYPPKTEKESGQFFKVLVSHLDTLFKTYL